MPGSTTLRYREVRVEAVKILDAALAHDTIQVKIATL